MSSDWDAKPVAVPYANFGDPQTLNLYSYVENSPVDRVDADGHAPSQGSPTWLGSSEGPCDGGWSIACIQETNEINLGTASLSGESLDEMRYDAMVQATQQSAVENSSSKAQQQSGTSGTEAQNESHQYDLVVERTNSLLNGATDQNGDTLDARDHLDSSCHLAGGNCAFNINHDPNDPTDAAFSSALNKALGEKDGDTGAHGGLTPPTHRVGFSTSLHHDNDALHVDHFNGAKFPIGTLFHAIVDVGIGSAFYGTHRAFSYSGVQ
jgi:hypothetical protein